MSNDDAPDEKEEVPTATPTGKRRSSLLWDDDDEEESGDEVSQEAGSKRQK